MSTETNRGGRPEIGGKAAPVDYGPELLAAINRMAADSGQSRAAWLRDTALERVNREVPPTMSLGWSTLTAFGIDTDRVTMRHDYPVETYQLDSLDGLSRIIFGVSTADQNDVIPEGQHKGWDIGWYELIDEGDGQIQESFSSSDYFEPFDWRSMLEDVLVFARKQ
jgi:hypothetical protein